MVVQGARRTINYQAFEVQVAQIPDAKAVVFIEPEGTAHVFALAEEARLKLIQDLQAIQTASIEDLARLRKNGQP